MTRWRLALVASCLLSGLIVGLTMSRGTGGVSVQQLLRQSGQPPSFSLLLRHNAPPLVFALLGVVTFGLSTIAALVGIGLSLAQLVADVRHSSLPLMMTLAATVPHGIPEVVAYVLAGGCGLGGVTLLRPLARADMAEVGVILRSSTRLGVRAIVWLAGAALLEMWATPVAIRLTAALW